MGESADLVWWDMGVVVELDKKGRIVIPLEVRREFDSRRFILRKLENRLELIPLPNPKAIKGKYKLEGSLEDIEELEEKRLAERD